MLFAVRRKRKREYPLKHHSLDDDFDDSTYLKEDYDAATSIGGLSTPERKTHIVGESDSIVSGLTGYTRDNQRTFESPRIRRFDEMEALADRNVHHDVHKCSSATCEVCEQQRQAGIQFIPVGMPSHSNDSLPSESDRGYVADDTVDL